MSLAAEAVTRELDEKTKVIAHLTKTLADTRDCLEIARAALEAIAEDGGRGPSEPEAHLREIALKTLERI